MWTAFPCVSVKDGTTTVFEYRFEENADERGRRIWEYFVRHPDAAVNKGHQYYAKFRQVDDEFVQVTMLDNGSQVGCDSYRGKGITEQLFKVVKATTGLRLISSSNKVQTFDDEGDFRSESATNVWKHLVENGKAVALANEDRFEYLGANPEKQSTPQAVTPAAADSGEEHPQSIGYEPLPKRIEGLAT